MLGIVGIEPIADLGIILATAAIASMILQRLRQPAVIGYLIAGVLLGAARVQRGGAGHRADALALGAGGDPADVLGGAGVPDPQADEGGDLGRG
jgi:Kef-type K+ transport system membrane component KefB